MPKVIECDLCGGSGKNCHGPCPGCDGEGKVAYLRGDELDMIQNLLTDDGELGSLDSWQLDRFLAMVDSNSI